MQPHTTTPAEREALIRLDGAFKDLDALNPEVGLQLVRNLLERLQMTPQIHAHIAPPKLPLPAIPTPKKDILRRKRTQSMNDGGDRRRPSSRQNNYELILEDDGELDEDEDREKTQGEMLADVLYARWVAGLRSRWEDRQMQAIQQMREREIGRAHV